MYAYMGVYRKYINHNLLKAWAADFGLSAHISLCKVNYEYVV